MKQMLRMCDALIRTNRCKPNTTTPSDPCLIATRQYRLCVVNGPVNVLSDLKTNEDKYLTHEVPETSIVRFLPKKSAFNWPKESECDVNTAKQHLIKWK